MFLLVSELDQNGACESLQDQILPLGGGAILAALPLVSLAAVACTLFVILITIIPID